MATRLVIFLNKRLEVSLNMGLYLLNPQSLHVVRLAEDITQGRGRGARVLERCDVSRSIYGISSSSKY